MLEFVYILIFTTADLTPELIIWLILNYFGIVGIVVAIVFKKRKKNRLRREKLEQKRRKKEAEEYWISKTLEQKENDEKQSF